MQAPDGKYYWVMFAKDGNVICRSERYDRKLGALYTANMIRRKYKVDLEDKSLPSVQRAKYVMGSFKKVYGF